MRGFNVSPDGNSMSGRSARFTRERDNDKTTSDKASPFTNQGRPNAAHCRTMDLPRGCDPPAKWVGFFWKKLAASQALAGSGGYAPLENVVFVEARALGGDLRRRYGPCRAVAQTELFLPQLKNTALVVERFC